MTAPHMAARYRHRVAVLRSGRLETVGPPGQVLTDAVMERVYSIQAPASTTGIC